MGLDSIDLLDVALQVTLFACTAAAVCVIIWAGASMDDCEELTLEKARKKINAFDWERYVLHVSMSEAEERPAALTPAQRDRILCEREAS